MTINTALSSFNKAPHMTVSESIAGFPTLQLVNKDTNTKATIHLYGAQVTHFEAKGRKILFLSDKALFTAGKAIRGGIPICWPQFSGQGKLPAHGIVRNRLWELKSSEVDAQGAPQVTLVIRHSAETLTVWPHEFELHYTVRLDHTLSTEITICNLGDREFSSQLALHTYLTVSEITKITIEGLEGKTVDDYTHTPVVTLREDRKQVTIDGWTDRLYKETAAELKLFDRGSDSIVSIQKEQLADSVVWNPWVEKSREMNDLAPDDFHRFVCIESGQISIPFVIKPQEVVCCRQEIQSI